MTKKGPVELICFQWKYLGHSFVNKASPLGDKLKSSITIKGEYFIVIRGHSWGSLLPMEGGALVVFYYEYMYFRGPLTQYFYFLLRSLLSLIRNALILPERIFEGFTYKKRVKRATFIFIEEVLRVLI